MFTVDVKQQCNNGVGQGPIARAVGPGGGCLAIFSLVYHFIFFSPSLWETARYRLKYCHKGPLSPKHPTNQCHIFKGKQGCYFLLENLDDMTLPYLGLIVKKLAPILVAKSSLWLLTSLIKGLDSPEMSDSIKIKSWYKWKVGSKYFQNAVLFNVYSLIAITVRHSDTTISSSEHTWCGYPGLLDRKKCSDMCRQWESNPRLHVWKANTLSTGPGAPRLMVC